MKRSYLLFASFIALFLSVTSCDDDDKIVDTTAPASIEVASITAMANITTVELEWANPSDSDYAYTIIKYNNLTEQSVKVLKDENSVIIDELTAEKEYTFTFTSYDELENASASTTKKVTTSMSVAKTILSTVGAENGRVSATVTWTNATEASITVMVEYTDADAAATSADAKNNIVKDGSLEITNLSAGIQNIDVTITDANGDIAKKTIEINPSPAIATTILSTVDTEDGITSAKVTWTNESEASITVKVGYSDADGVELNEEATDNTDKDGSLDITNLLEGVQNIDVTITDAEGNVAMKTIEINPIAASSGVKLDNANWSIIDFSSQEAGEANDNYPDNGLAKAAIDGSLDSFWHTEWAKSENDIFPHHFVVDLGEEVSIHHFETFTRQGDSRGHKKCEYEVSTDNLTWTNIGSFDVDNSSDDAQIQKPNAAVTARYVKFIATEGDDSNSWVETFTFMAEFNVYIEE